MKSILIIDGSLAGEKGNTSDLLIFSEELLKKDFKVEKIVLNQIKDYSLLHSSFEQADGFIFGTGTYWSSWSSHLQRFLEQTTEWEGTNIWLGKPVCSIVTMHSVGGLEVLQRLQMTLNLAGAFIPPHCGLAYSKVGQESEFNQHDSDTWTKKDIPIVLHNFKEAINQTFQWKTWEVDNTHFQDKWIK
jgi:multimeric flavodoxin WrbA